MNSNFIKLFALWSMVLWGACTQASDLKEIEEDLKSLLVSPQKQLELMMSNIEKENSPLTGFEDIFKNTIKAFSIVMKEDKEALKKIEAVGKIGEDEFSNKTMNDRGYLLLHTFLSAIRSGESLEAIMLSFPCDRYFSDDVRTVYEKLLSSSESRLGILYKQPLIFLPVTTVDGYFELSVRNKAYINTIGICGVSLSNDTHWKGLRKVKSSSLLHWNIFSLFNISIITPTLKKVFKKVLGESKEASDQLFNFLHEIKVILLQLVVTTEISTCNISPILRG